LLSLPLSILSVFLSFCQKILSYTLSPLLSFLTPAPCSTDGVSSLASKIAADRFVGVFREACFRRGLVDVGASIDNDDDGVACGGGGTFYVSPNASSTSRSNSSDTHNNLPISARFNSTIDLPIKWCNDSYGNVRRQAESEGRLLLVYIHPPGSLCGLGVNSANSENRTFLSDPLLTTTTNSSDGTNTPDIVNSLIAPFNLLPWGVSAESSQGWRLMEQLNVSRLPWMGVVYYPPSSSSSSSSSSRNSNSNNNRSRNDESNDDNEFDNDNSKKGLVICSICGPPPSLQSITEYFAPPLAIYHQKLSDFVSARSRREEDSRLVAEQNREYEEMMALDRERSQRRLEEEERRERELREEEDRKRDLEESKNTELALARSRLRDCGAGDEGSVKVRFTLPTGRKIDRHFFPDDTVGSMRDFLRVSEENEVENVGLALTWPRRELNGEDDQMVEIRELAGGGRQVVVMVVDLDA